EPRGPRGNRDGVTESRLGADVVQRVADAGRLEGAAGRTLRVEIVAFDDEPGRDRRTAHPAPFEGAADLGVVRRAVFHQAVVVVQRQQVEGDRLVDARARVQ